MIEIKIDQSEIDRQLARIGNIPVRLAECVRLAMKETAPEVRQRVTDMLQAEVALVDDTVEKSIGRVMYHEGGERFRIASRNLPLEKYQINPLEQTARKGMVSRQWPGFSYWFRKGGKEYGSRGTVSGKDGTGSLPFLAPAKPGGSDLQVRYRRSGKLFRVFGPSVQYHAMMPQVLTEARELGQHLFSKNLDRIVSETLEGQS